MQTNNFGNNGGELRKLILFGLDNAGKTSIVLTLKGDKSLLSYYSLSPTKDHKITNMEIGNTQINIWDFGGQEAYRDNHLKKINEYIEGTSKIIYVIDVQDYKRYEKALAYFQRVLELIIDHRTDIDFSIFLHKYDPNIESRVPNLNVKIKELIETIKGIMPKDIDYRIFKTTIHTTFEKIPVFL
ncbi:MAG: GTP-binding protein [Candidatus Lokiarchaeota archaeon]|nr:GTP-binding protein [Candidatus Lokiarchaeota archaeon]